MRAHAAAAVVSLVAIVYVVLVVAAVWRSPDTGFRIRIGRDVAKARADIGIRVGERIEAVDGEPVVSSMGWAQWRQSAEIGREAVMTVRGPDGAVRQVPVVPRATGASPLVLVIAAFSVLLVAFALLLRLRAPGDALPRRFFATTLPFPFIYVGAVAAPHLLADPVVIGALAASLGLAPAGLRDFFASFPTPGPAPSTRARGALIAIGAVGAAAVIAIFAAARAGSGDGTLRAGIAGLLGLGALNLAVAAEGLVRQWRRARTADPTERAQLKWLLVGFGLVFVHTASIVPGAIGDPGWFTVGGFAPLVAGSAIFWFGASTLAVLRVRLSAVDAVVPSSLVYSAAARGSVVAAVLIVVAVGTIVHDAVPGATAVAAAATAIAAAALFGPAHRWLRARLDAWFLRDRSRYVERLHEATGELAPLRDSSALARVAVERAIAAVHADGGAIYLPAADRPDRFALAHAAGAGAYPPALHVEDGAITGAGDAMAWPVAGARIEAILVLGPRLGGDGYGEADRHLLGTLGGLLATAFETARSSAVADDLGARLALHERELGELRRRAPGRVARVPAPAADGPPPVLVGESAASRALRQTLDRIAGSASSVLLVGETGSGKGIAARAIHDASDRAAGPFVAVDCAAIAPGVFESDLFGHERGAFTDADRARTGFVELADDGTLFLDEIGELPLALQPKLLRVLQERAVVRVGGHRARRVDLRVIAATHRDLDAMVRAGGFREDLLFRLRVVEVAVPPLRDRLDDLDAIVAALLPRLARRTGVGPIEVRPDAVAALRRHGWPGNIRELENTLERAVVLGGAASIGAADLVLDARRAPRRADLPPDVDEPGGHREYLDAVERTRLIAALDAAKGNRAQAARRLGIPRTTLINKLRRHGLP